MTETEAGAEFDAAIHFRHLLAHQILAGDAEIDAAITQLARDFRGRKESDLDIVETFDTAAIGALIADGDDFQAGALEDRGRILLHAPLGGHGDGDGHERALSASIRSSHKAKPTAGIWLEAPSSVISRSKRPPPARTAWLSPAVTSKTRPV